LPWVRRPSGGGAIIHDIEVTYCLALPAGSPWQTAESWLLRMHAIVAVALAELGVTARRHVAPANEPPCEGCLCFRHFTAGDLVIAGGRVAGSAQRRLRKALLQHGSILLAASPAAPTLPGIRELSGRDLGAAEVCSALERAFAERTGWPLRAGPWTD